MFGERLRLGEPLHRHTSFRIGGPADVWIEVSSAQEIAAAQRVAARAGLPLMIFGGGTNVLVSDRGIRGIVIRLGRAYNTLEWLPHGNVTRLRAGGATRFKKLVTGAARRGLTGLEFAEGIPGSLGGGLLMNAGAFGGEIATVLDAVVGVHPEHGEQRLTKGELRFGYRFFDLPAGFVVTHVEFTLQPGDRGEIEARIADARRRREAHQPLGLPNAGSVFKNPPGHHAGKLIDSLGLKGARVGGAMVSERHANFIVNTGNASARDVRELMRQIAEAVWAEKGVRLVPEIKLLGEWDESTDPSDPPDRSDESA